MVLDPESLLEDIAESNLETEGSLLYREETPELLLYREELGLEAVEVVFVAESLL